MPLEGTSLGHNGGIQTGARRDSTTTSILADTRLNILRAPPEQIRQGYPTERSERNVDVQALPLMQRLHDRMKKARGPVTYVDLTTKHRQDVCSDQVDASQAGTA